MSRASGSAQLEVARIQSEINRLFESLLRLRGGSGSSTAWTPNVDVAETEKEVIVDVEVPGVAPGSIAVSAQGGELRVTGTRAPSLSEAQAGASVLHDERETGDFDLAVPIPCAVNTRRATAKLDKGLLRISMPRVPNRRGESVSVDVEIVE